MRTSTRWAVLPLGVSALAGLLAVSLASPARADEPKKANEPRMLSEPGEVTDVIDAFDGDDPFDLHFTLGFQQTWKSANVRRESYINNVANPSFASGGYTATNMNVAEYKESTSKLNTRVDLGLYQDLAIYFRLPIILTNTRQLDDLSGSSKQIATVAQGAPGEEPLFRLPFKSPQRSGIDYLAVGLDWALLNQARDRTKPTWLIGEPMHACNSNKAPGQVECAHPSDFNRDGVASTALLDPAHPTAGFQDGSFSGSRSPGVSRGTTGLEAHTMLAKRIKYIEPYGGFRALFEFAQDRSDFGATDIKGSLVNHPPLQGWMILGIQVIPYEHREEFQRVTFDFRFTGAYRSEGRDYSELFDALGSSTNKSMRSPNFAAYQKNPDATTSGAFPSVVNPNSQKIYFGGITDVQAYGTLGASASVTWQAAEYIKFQLGVGYTHEQSHLITQDQPCNPDFKDDVGQSGPCRTTKAIPTGLGISATGIPNPNYRPVIDAVGRRFRVDDSDLWDTWLNAVVMF